MWKIDEHIVFLVILFALVLTVFSNPPEQQVLSSYSALVPSILLGLLGLLMVLSSLWAPHVHSTLAYAGLSVLHILIGFLLSLLVGIREVFAGITLGAFAVSVYSFALSIAQGFPSDESIPLGLFTNKSDLSYLLGIGLITSIALFSRRTVTNLLIMAVASFLLWHISLLDYLTTSVAIAAASFVLVASAVVKILPAHKRFGGSTVSLIAGAVALVLIWTFREPLQVLAGKTPDFSGRVPIWQRFWENIQDKPLSGVGWGWTRDEFGGTDRILPHQEIFPAHNGFIDIAFSLGIPGAILLAGALLVSFVLSYLRSIGTSSSWVYLGLPVLLTYLVVHDLSGSWLPRVLGLFLMALLFGLIGRVCQGTNIMLGARRSALLPQS
jgi:O-antigen ligase